MKSKTTAEKPEPRVQSGVSLFSDFDVYLFKQGNHYRLFEKLGAHVMTVDDVKGTYFAVWAPNAKKVSVVGDFNHWNPETHPLTARWDGSGIWEGFITGIDTGTLYKFHIDSNYNGYKANRGDPFAFFWEEPPKTSPIVWNLDYEWQDQEWMNERKEKNKLSAPISIYEIHLGSWRRKPDNQPLSYREIAPELADYLLNMGFTHVEFLPVMEHPFYGSWGLPDHRIFCPYQPLWNTPGFHVPHRLSAPEGDRYPRLGPITFPGDEHGLAYYDGTCVYEHSDPKKGFHPDWKSFIFNYGRNEVQGFLLSSAIFWLENTTSMVYGSMLWLRCSTLITPDVKENGSPMYLEEGKTWKQSLSLKNSMRKSIKPSLMCRPLPKNQLHGQWSPVRFMSAAWGLV